MHLKKENENYIVGLYWRERVRIGCATFDDGTTEIWKLFYLNIRGEN